MKNEVSWRNSTGEVYFSRRHLRRKAENSKDNNAEPCVVCASPNVVQLFFLPADHYFPLTQNKEYILLSVIKSRGLPNLP